MKHTKFIVAASAVSIAFGVGHLTAQPARITPPPAAPAVDHEKEAFKGDLGAAVKQNNHKKIVTLLGAASGNARLTDALVHRVWDNAYNQDPGGDRNVILQLTFGMQQQQRQIELLEQILAEMKKTRRPEKP